MVVVGIIAIPLSLLVSQHVQSAYRSEDYTLALNLARFEMERADNLNYTTGLLNASFTNYQGYNYDVARTVAYAQGNAASIESLKRVAVDVTKSGNVTILVSLVTYIAKNVRYGI